MGFLARLAFGLLLVYSGIKAGFGWPEIAVEQAFWVRFWLFWAENIKFLTLPKGFRRRVV